MGLPELDSGAIWSLWDEHFWKHQISVYLDSMKGTRGRYPEERQCVADEIKKVMAGRDGIKDLPSLPISSHFSSNFLIGSG